jgi:hypothetical protein
MGYYYGTRSAEEVQAQNGGRYTFDTIKAKYESIKPLRGKRKDQNLRPLGERRRDWEQVFKLSENEYYVSNEAYSFRLANSQPFNRAITWKRSDDGTMDYITIHTPKRLWDTTNPQALAVLSLSPPSTYFFYSYNMPDGLSMHNHYSNKYVCLRPQNGNYQYYTLEQGDITFQRKVGEQFWQPLVVHRQFKHTLDRTKTKELRQSVQPFLEYYKMIEPLIDKTAYHYGNPMQGFDESIFKQSGDEVPEGWFTIAERYKYRSAWRTFDIIKWIYKDLYQIAKPCVAEEVPLGQLTIDRYKKWY